MDSASDRLDFFRVEDVGSMASHYTIEAVVGPISMLPGSTFACQAPLIAGVFQDRDVVLSETPAGGLFVFPSHPSPPTYCNHGIAVGTVDPNAEHDLRMDATRDGDVLVYADGSLIATLPWSDLWPAPDLSGAPYFAPPNAVVAEFGTLAGLASQWKAVSYTVQVTPVPPGLEVPSFTASTPFETSAPITDAASLAAVLDTPYVLVSSLEQRARRHASTPMQVIIRPPETTHTVLLSIDARTASRTRAIRLRSMPQALRDLPPIVDIRAWATDFNLESMSALNQPPSRIDFADGTDEQDVVGGQPVEVDRLALDGMGPKATTAHVHNLGWLRFDGRSRIVGVDDLNWTDDTLFGDPLGTPSIADHLTSDESWQDLDNDTPWVDLVPRAAPHTIMGTLDLPRMTLHVGPPAGLSAATIPIANSWPVTPTVEPYTAQTDNNGHYSVGGQVDSAPSNLYRAFLGVPADAASLTPRAGGPFSYTMTPASGSGGGCFSDAVATDDGVTQVRVDKVELHAPYGPGGTTYAADAGQLFLQRQGGVGLPYLTSGGALPVGTTKLTSTCAQVETVGTASSP